MNDDKLFLELAAHLNTIQRILLDNNLTTVDEYLNIFHSFAPPSDFDDDKEKDLNCAD